jgi:hypothetical protein
LSRFYSIQYIFERHLPFGEMMKHANTIRSTIMAFVIVMVVVSTAYLAAGTLHQRLAPEPEPEHPVELSIVPVDTYGFASNVERPHLTDTPTAGVEYDFGIRMKGLKAQEGVSPLLYLCHPTITASDVEAYFYNPATYTWWPIVFTHDGTALVASIGDSEGYGMIKGSEVTILVIAAFPAGHQPNVVLDYLLIR